MTDLQTPAENSRLIETAEMVGFPLLGWTVVPRLEGVEVSEATIKALLKPYNWEEHLPRLAEPNTRFLRAVKQWMKEIAKNENLFETGGEEDYDKVKKLVRPMGDSKASLIGIAVVTEGIDLTEYGVDYETSLRLFLEKDTENIYVTRSKRGSANYMGPEERRLQTSLVPHWDYYKDIYMAADLNRMVQRIIMSLSTTRVRKEGGAYFVPYVTIDAQDQEIPQAPILQALKDLLEIALPAGPGGQNTSSLTAIPVIDRPTTRAQIANLSFMTMKSELKDIETDLLRFTEDARKPVIDPATGEPKKAEDGTIMYHKIRPSTVTRLLDKCKGKRDKAKLYYAKLGMQQSEIWDIINGLEENAKQLAMTAADIMAQESGDDQLSEAGE